jgi:hypothetical protein
MIQKKVNPIFIPRLFELLFEAAHNAGLYAVKKANIPETEWYPCGFAWVTIRPANCGFAKWMKENKGCRKAYEGGMNYWISLYNQSMARKELYAVSFADMIQTFGIQASAGSRID